MRLSAGDFDAAASQEEFCQQWSQFLHRNDVLVVYHRRTYQLLQQVNALQPSCLVLKSIFGNWRSGIRSLEELMAVEGVTTPNPDGESRASQRLDMTVAMLEHLRTRYGRAR